MTVRIVAQDGPLLLVDTGQPLPGRGNVDHLDDVPAEARNVGRVYDYGLGQLLPSGAPLAYGMYLKQGEWYDVTLHVDVLAAHEEAVRELLAAE